MRASAPCVLAHRLAEDAAGLPVVDLKAECGLEASPTLLMLVALSHHPRVLVPCDEGYAYGFRAPPDPSSTPSAARDSAVRIVERSLRSVAGPLRKCFTILAGEASDGTRVVAAPVAAQATGATTRRGAQRTARRGVSNLKCTVLID